jgi:hypothetical protein
MEADDVVNPPPNPETREDISVEPRRESPPGIPRWLKVSGIVVIVLIVAAVAISFIAGFEHGPGQFGPGQHGPGSDAGGDPPRTELSVNGPRPFIRSGDVVMVALAWE